MGIRRSSSRGSEKERISSGTNEAIVSSFRAVTHQESDPYPINRCPELLDALLQPQPSVVGQFAQPSSLF
jgi:hypothetical protein